MKEIAKLAQEKGFKAKTFTTQWTFEYYTGEKRFLVTEICDYLLLCEIQKWVREIHYITVEVCGIWKEEDLPLTIKNKAQVDAWFTWDYYSDNFSIENAVKFETYEEALMAGIKETLENL